MDSDPNIRAKIEVITVGQYIAVSLDNGGKIDALTFVLNLTSAARSCGLMRISRC